ncbi:thioredoxin family protein [Chitinimonas koreensis]|uniref:thioredoxin family protein n=1 Tax=Chitinimonas koreensis TaxID=356302 RepID=UPI0003F653B1|nr:thioredoxin family protein [Chitinimonas koreensis]
MKRHLPLIAAWLIAAGPALAVTPPAGADHKLPPGIAWQQGDVDAAFALAKSSNKPLFLYWGAVWCPPCNQVKATLFNRQDFIDRTRQFIPVYLDGDSPGAQKLGAQFKVRGYPTMILFKPDGTEITRLPGEVDGERYLSTLELGLTAARPVKALLAAALKGDKLALGDWQLLADYSWDTDQAQLVPEDKLAATLLQLARAVPAGNEALAARLQLKALAAAATADKAPALDKPAAQAALAKVLGNPKLARDNFDVLVNYAGDIAGFVSESGPARDALVKAWDQALQRLAIDATLSTNDRLGAVTAQIALARLGKPEGALSEPLLKTVRAAVADADKRTTNGYERQSVISTAGYTLAQAGLLEESDKLLQAELKRSHSPYYFMLALASNAKQRGDKAAAVDWYEKAYASSEGPATRLQWGTTYVSGAVELAPQDEARIEKAASSVIGELAGTQNAFYERNRRSLEKLVAKLQGWNKDKKHDAAVKRVLGQLSGICGKLPAKDPQKPVCEGLVKPGKAA